jgi:hypothetical protein
MESPDQEKQFRHLKETYRQMTEEELCAMAEDAFDLTALARETLRAEIAERGLNIELTTTPPPPAVHALEDDLIGVIVVWNMAQARRVKDRLDASSIPSYLGPDNLMDLNDFKLSFDDGVDLKVSMGNQQRAASVLANRWPEDDIDCTILCPKCHSPEIVFQGREIEAADGLEAAEDLEEEEEESTLLDAKFNWSCDACGYQWKDDGIEQSV